MLGCGQGKINKIETRGIEIKLDELEKLIGILQPDDETADWMRSIARRWKDAKSGRSSNGWTAAFTELTDLESSAEVIRCWHSERIPGPLQSENYMLRMGSEDDGDSDVSALYKRRQARTKVVTAVDPPRYHVILSESSFHRMPGGRTPQLVVDQAEYLLSLVDEYDTFTLQILTFEAPIASAHGDFTIMRLDSAEKVYVEHTGGAMVYEMKPEYTKYWEQLCAAALTRQDSRQFIVDLIEEWRAKWHAE
ncbi:hypothetical protein ALI144C_35905 [Actinosynnema sp. ALI-1.44]|uniref:DUF5753 domain-containing protein n=1 Tax=Actinosynnema sp. ALI-1.44 TaxID=1933779 RepID=UPI00097C9336|nr:DUF5753 domain-containing protein [Actinosynnema sp. ALI-1.44]ONI76085.1 hypothetical protein ALI144C_35905 [Actinosynnema sp. ALI-1.44]